MLGGYLNMLEAIFQPAAKSLLSKEEFAYRVQGRKGNVITYLSAKMALYDVAFLVPVTRVETLEGGGQIHHEGVQDESVLIQQAIKGLYNVPVKQATLHSSPTTREQLRTAVVQAVANEHIAYHDSYAWSSNLDGLASATTSYTADQRGGQPNLRTEEPMEMDAMRDTTCY